MSVYNAYLAQYKALMELVRDLNDRIEEFKETYNPNNFIVNHDTTLGTNSSDTVTVNAHATFNACTTFNGHATFTSGLHSNCVDTCNLTVDNNATIGSCESCVHMNGNTHFAKTATFRRDLNLTSCEGTINAPYLNITKDTTLGTDSNNLLTINAQTTYNANLTVAEANTLNTYNLTATNNTTLGQDGDDDLTVNATTHFANINAPVTIEGEFTVNNDVTLGTNTTLVESLGAFNAPKMVLNQISGNTMMIGNNINLVEYVEFNANTNIATAYPNNLIIVIKNIATNTGGPIDISIYLGTNGWVTLPASKTGTFIKSTSATYTMLCYYNA